MVRCGVCSSIDFKILEKKSMHHLTECSVFQLGISCRQSFISTRIELHLPHCHIPTRRRKNKVPVTHDYKPSNLEGWDREDHSSRPAWAKKVHENPSQPTAGCSGMHLSSQAMWEVEIGRITVPTSLGKKKLQRPISTENLGMVTHTCHPSDGGKLK
jgi:hypothetical protein